MEAIVFRLIQVYVSNIVFTLKIRLCLYKIAINYSYCYSIKRLKKKYLLLLASKLIEKTPGPCNAKEHYQSFIRKKKITKTIRNNYLSTKNF